MLIIAFIPTPPTTFHTHIRHIVGIGVTQSFFDIVLAIGGTVNIFTPLNVTETTRFLAVLKHVRSIVFTLSYLRPILTLNFPVATLLLFLSFIVVVISTKSTRFSTFLEHKLFRTFTLSRVGHFFTIINCILANVVLVKELIVVVVVLLIIELIVLVLILITFVIALVNEFVSRDDAVINNTISLCSSGGNRFTNLFPVIV
mmetsp:Transcript_23655/g.28880  ORF Transcript_23655/g.28880 Transcript_23655/m.28880 type:complete len:201 (+) Transcript_23655:86-688(+)